MPRPAAGPPSERLPLVTFAPVALGLPEGRRDRQAAGPRIPRYGLVLITAAAVGAIVSGAYLYFESTHVHGEGPANRAPQATATITSTGVIPSEYLGTWEGALENAEGRHTRKMVIRQGYVDETVMTLTATGPAANGDVYRCVFKAELDSVTRNAVRLSASTRIAAKPASACTAGKPSKLTLLSKDRLRRAGGDEGDRMTYYRSGRRK